MDGKERGARHAVLQARPRRTPERARTAWEPLVERAHVPPEREDLCAREVEPGGHPAEALSVRSRSCISQVWSSTWYAV